MAERIKLPIGVDLFKKMREDGFFYIDKTRLIEQLLENGGEVNLFTRPRRFGKTLNMSMLRCFFEIGTEPDLFDGLYISFREDLCEKYMGKCQMDGSILLDWLNNIKHFLDSKITIDYTIIKNGKSTKHKIKRTPRGLVDLVDAMSPFKHSGIYYSKDTTHINEDVRLIKSGGKVINKTLKRDVDLEFAFCFNMNLMEPMTRSFCNFVHTIDEGDHTQAVINGICQFFSKKTRESLTEKEKEKYNILYNDITSNLVLVLSLSTSLDPGFTGQTKEKIENKKLIKPLTDLVKSSLENHFNENKKELKKFTDIIKTNAKARFEAIKK